SPKRPVIAVVGLNQATETTDYLLTAGVLRRADVADVVLLATNRGPVQLYPALKVEADQSLSEFDALHPEGADYVIVPAMSRYVIRTSWLGCVPSPTRARTLSACAQAQKSLQQPAYWT